MLGTTGSIRFREECTVAWFYCRRCSACSPYLEKLFADSHIGPASRQRDAHAARNRDHRPPARRAPVGASVRRRRSRRERDTHQAPRSRPSRLAATPCVLRPSTGASDLHHLRLILNIAGITHLLFSFLFRPRMRLLEQGEIEQALLFGEKLPETVKRIVIEKCPPYVLLPIRHRLTRKRTVSLCDVQSPMSSEQRCALTCSRSQW